MHMPAAVDVPLVGIKLPDKLVVFGAGNANTEMLRHARIGKSYRHDCIIGSCRPNHKCRRHPGGYPNGDNRRIARLLCRPLKRSGAGRGALGSLS